MHVLSGYAVHALNALPTRAVVPSRGRALAWADNFMPATIRVCLVQQANHDYTISVPYLDLVIEALVKEADAEAQIFTVLLLLPEQLCLAVIAEGEAVAGEALLHLASVRVDVAAQGLRICLLTHPRN